MSVKRYTNGADDDQGTILPFMEESPNGDYVEYADYVALLATNERVCQRFAKTQVEANEAEAENARLKAEVERLKGIILAQSSDFVRSKTADDGIKPDGHNDLAGRAVERCLELQAEVERLTKAGDAIIEWFGVNDYSHKVIKEWNATKEGKQS